MSGRFEDVTGMKLEELAKKCAICGRGVAHDGALTFWRLTFERFVLLRSAIQREHGLELMVSSPAIARVLSPNEDLARRAGGEHCVLICDHCSIHGGPLAVLAERISDRESEAAEGRGDMRDPSESTGASDAAAGG